MRVFNPETDAEKSAQSGSKPVGLWRQFRRAKPQDMTFDETLNEVRHACD